jgi:hypothetical protein
MGFRKLRIAWSVFWGLAAVLLIVLWVRSYRISDTIGHIDDNLVCEFFLSQPGALRYSRMNDKEVGGPNSEEPVPWGYGNFPAIRAPGPIPDFSYEYLPDFQCELWLPYWYPVALSASVAAIPWVSKLKRFSLRTLLIATTLVAVALGLIVWAGR